MFFHKHDFHGGVHPAERYGGKSVTGSLPVIDVPAPARAAIPLSQHVGAPCKPLVAPGDRVLLGQKIGEATGFVGAPVHASVSGKVISLVSRPSAGGAPVQCVLVENDGLDEWTGDLPAPADDPFALDKDELLARVREAGLVGLGGAAFPLAVKLAPKKPIDIVILNGAECEPYLTGDHRAMLEESENVYLGLRIAMKIVDAPNGVVAIEENKPDAIDKMRALGAQVQVLPARYPQGGEKALIRTVTGREVPSGGLPMDAGALVLNVSTAASLAKCLKTGRPLIDTVVTVTGLVARPGNLRLRVGSTIADALDFCGGAVGGATRMLLGGPMMGLPAYDMATPFVKASSGLLLLPDESREMSNCIRCGSCVETCPMKLMPLNLYQLASREKYEETRAEHVLDCIECGSCSYGCPARLPLVQTIRVAKREIRRLAK